MARVTAGERSARRAAPVVGPGGAAGAGDEPVPVALELLREYLAAQSTAFLAQLPRLRQGRPEAPHRIRVACRRSRSMLRTYRPLLDPEWADELAEQIGQFTAVIAPEREIEVVRGRLMSALDELPDDSGGVPRARSLLDRLLQREAAAAHEATLAALAGPRFHALADRIALAPQTLPGLAAARKSAPEALFPLVAHSFESLGRRVAALPDPLSQDPKSSVGDEEADRLWHRVRIGAKHTRYAAEVCVPAAGPGAAAFAKRLAALTDDLGTQQDAAAAGTLLLRAARTPRIAAPTGFVLGRLLGDARAGILRGRLAWPALWARAADPACREWLGQD